MRARSVDLEGVDATDSVGGEDNLPAGRISTVGETETVTATSVVDPYPANDEIVAETGDAIAEDGTIVDGVYGFGGLSDMSWQVDVNNLQTLDVDVLPPVYGTAGNDYIFGNHYLRDEIYGLGGDDYLWGGDELGKGDRIEGGTGNDQIFGGFGEDYLRGDEGDDVVDGGASSDVIYGNEGNDVLWGDWGDDKLYGMTGADELHGDDGNDYLDLGDYGDDHVGGVAFGGAGNDVIKAGQGIDHLYGGEGNDKISGGSDVDYLDGGDGDDALDGGSGHDMLWGGAGNDELLGYSGYDLFFAGAGDDVVYGDYINPYSEFGDADTLYGEYGNDRLYGGGGNDNLYGGNEHDTVHGGYGDDVIDGGAGSDRMTGGAGRDTFVLADRPHQVVGSPYGYSELDVITDFQRYPPADGGDIVDMRALFNSSTDFTGTTAEQAVLQGYLYFVQRGSPGEAGYGTMVYIDPNGHAPDPTTYYHPHDIAAVLLEGVGPGELGTPGPSYAGLNNHFLV